MNEGTKESLLKILAIRKIWEQNGSSGNAVKFAKGHTIKLTRDFQYLEKVYKELDGKYLIDELGEMVRSQLHDKDSMRSLDNYIGLIYQLFMKSSEAIHDKLLTVMEQKEIDEKVEEFQALLSLSVQ